MGTLACRYAGESPRARNLGYARNPGKEASPWPDNDARRTIAGTSGQHDRRRGTGCRKGDGVAGPAT